jgi:hypothetical protein
MQQVTDTSRLTSRQEPRCRRPEAPARPPDCWQPGPERAGSARTSTSRCVAICAARDPGQLVCQFLIDSVRHSQLSKATCCRSCLSRWKTSCSETPAALSCSGPASGGSPSVRRATLSTWGQLSVDLAPAETCHSTCRRTIRISYAHSTGRAPHEVTRRCRLCDAGRGAAGRSSPP